MAAAHSPLLTPSLARARWSDVCPEVLVGLALLPLMAAAFASAGAPGSEGQYVHWWGTARGWEALGRTLKLSLLAALTAVAGRGGLVRYQPEFRSV